MFEILSEVLDFILNLTKVLSFIGNFNCFFFFLDLVLNCLLEKQIEVASGF